MWIDGDELGPDGASVTFAGARWGERDREVGERRGGADDGRDLDDVGDGGGDPGEDDVEDGVPGSLSGPCGLADVSEDGTGGVEVVGQVEADDLAGFRVDAGRWGGWPVPSLVGRSQSSCDLDAGCLVVASGRDEDVGGELVVARRLRSAAFVDLPALAWRRSS